MRNDQPSATARLVALGILYIARDPRWRHLVPPESTALSERLLQSASGARLLLAATDRPAPRAAIAFTEQLILPGILLHYALRKRRLEEVTRDSLASSGIRQVVILGAGLDTLALRLHREFRDVTFVESDHPATQRFKRRALSAADLPVGENLRFHAADLANAGWARDLRLESQTRSLFVAEGLLMYLSAPRVESVFRAVSDRSAPGSRFAFTFLEPQGGGEPDFAHSTRAANLYLRLRGEPFRWGITRDALPAFLGRRGFQVEEIDTLGELRRRFGIPARDNEPVNGDMICLARKEG